MDQQALKNTKNKAKLVKILRELQGSKLLTLKVIDDNLKNAFDLLKELKKLRKKEKR